MIPDAIALTTDNYSAKYDAFITSMFMALQQVRFGVLFKLQDKSVLFVKIGRTQNK
jgi:hypothetical protein